MPKARGKPETKERGGPGHRTWQRSQGKEPLESRPPAGSPPCPGPRAGADSGPQQTGRGVPQKTNGQMAERRRRLQPPLGKLIKPSISAGQALSASRAPRAQAALPKPGVNSTQPLSELSPDQSETPSLCLPACLQQEGGGHASSPLPPGVNRSPHRPAGGGGRRGGPSNTLGLGVLI